jgi:large subunit ribosomal protein L32e
MTTENKNKGKRKKPSFIRTDAHKKKKLGDKWRRPKGYQNKRRLRKKGYAPVVKTGYMSSKDSRSKSREGLELVMVSNLKDLESIDKKTQCAIISGTLGNKKRLVILEKAKELGLKVNNLNVDNKIAEIKKSIENKKKEKQEILKKKEAKKKSAKKAEDKKEKTVEDTVNEDKKSLAKKEDKTADTKENKSLDKTDDKDKEKKDFDKLLTKKQ